MKYRLIVVILMVGLLLPQKVEAKAEPPDASQMGAQIVARAKEWVDAGVPYDQNALRDGYRTDCSGLASFAWQIRNPNGSPSSPDGVSLATQYGTKIPFDNLSPGDIVDNLRYGDDGHLVIFVRWIEKGLTFEAYEENGGENYNKAVATVLNLQGLKGGGITISEYEKYAPGPYFAFRLYSIPGFLIVTEGPCVWTAAGECLDKVNIGQEVNASFKIRNDGGQPVFLYQLMAGARGPWARVQGWSGPNADFPPEINLTLQPGQSYSYNQSRSFSLIGDYFVEAVQDEHGWESIVPFPRVSFDVVK
jgi:hypothetical protein